MNNSLGDALEDAHHAAAENEHAAAQRSMPSNHQLPTPPRSSNASYDHSDAASMDSENTASSRRRYQRGGRKKKKKKGGKLHSVSEFELPKGGQLQQQETPTGVQLGKETPSPDDYDVEELQKARSSRPTGSNEERPPGTAPKAGGTGIRAINIARAEALGGGQPLGITIERPKSKDKSRRTGKEKGDKKAGEGSRGKGGGEGEGEEQDGDTETDRRKPVSIRLDLNLEIEIFLRAKIIWRRYDYLFVSLLRVDVLTIADSCRE
jgi:hypothetical protein